MSIGMNNIGRATMVLSAGLAFALSTPAAAATTQTATMGVSATVADNCSITATPVAFGTVDVTSGTAATAQGGITVKCTVGTSWSATASLGTHASGSTRRMALSSDPTKLLTYELFRDAGLSNTWTSDSSGAATGSGTGSNDSISIYARVPTGQQTAALGAYADSVTVTVTY